MNRLLHPLLLLSAGFLSVCATAQTTNGADTLITEIRKDTTAIAITSLPPKPAYLRNVVKMNLSSLFLKNYNFYYERLITRKTSVLAGFRTMPPTNLGNLKLSDKIATVAEDDGMQDELSLITASNKTLTAEIRFYAGRKPGAKGFYFGLYGRKADFNTSYMYEYATDTKSYIIPLQAKSSGLGGGFLMGAQFAIAKRVMVDVYLLGAHYGKLTGNVTAGVDLSELSATQKADLQESLNDLLVASSTSFLNTDVSNTGVTGKIAGPFAGVRGLGLSVGFSF